jgi:hypothetical protein
MDGGHSWSCRGRPNGSDSPKRILPLCAKLPYNRRWKRPLALTFEQRGVKGLGIALVAAQKAQTKVVLVDNSQTAIDKSLKFAGMVR